MYGRYTSFHANAKRPDLRKTKHYLSWQPKALGTAAVDEGAALVAALDPKMEGVGGAAKALVTTLTARAHPRAETTPFFLNVGECVVGGGAPARLALEECIGACTDAPVQFTSISADTARLTAPTRPA